MLEYKAEEASTRLVKMNPSGTSQECKRCGMAVPKESSERVYCCPYYDFTLDRNVNATRNILKGALTLEAAQNVFLPRGPREVTPARENHSIKQEAPSARKGWFTSACPRLLLQNCSKIEQKNNLRNLPCRNIRHRNNNWHSHCLMEESIIYLVHTEEICVHIRTHEIQE